MQKTVRVSVTDLVITVFTKPPRDACTFKLNLLNAASATSDRDMYNIQMFPYLMDIFINGAIALFGQTVTPQNMTQEQFELTKKYMLSLGQQVMHRYEQTEDDKILVHIWFEPINKLTDCRGYVSYH